MMTLFRKLKKIRRYPPAVVFRILLERITFEHVRIRRFYLLVYESVPEIGLVRGPGAVRHGDVSDAGGMEDLEHAGKVELFRERFREGDRCAVAVYDGRVIGYEWYSLKPFHTEQRYRYTVPIPADALFTYDAFIRQEYRVSGIWLKLMNYIGEQMKLHRRSKIITIIDSDNDLSLNTHIRFGFRIFESVLVLSLGRMRFFRTRQMRSADGRTTPGPETRPAVGTIVVRPSAQKDRAKVLRTKMRE